jgi:two-component system alkaline phosphatase synthesis response regulator PhoP
MARHPFRVLVVDDDRDILQLLKYNLEKEGLAVKVLQESKHTVKVARKFIPDLIILDIMMPEPNGMRVCQELRTIHAFQHAYIFFLTATSGEAMQQTAFDSGGDDFIEKFTGLRALIYKVNSVLSKKYTIRKGVSEINAGSLTIVRKNRCVFFRGVRVSLTEGEFDLLFFFAQNPDKTITSETLIQNIWGSKIFLLQSSVELYIRNLRNKISPDIIWIKNKNEFVFRL